MCSFCSLIQAFRWSFLPVSYTHLFPLVLSGIGIIASVIGIFMVRGKEGSNPANALNLGTYVSGIIVVIATIILSKAMLGSFNYAIAIIAGLVVGIAIGKITEVYTSGDYKSVKKIAEQSQTGSATTIISGLGVGMLSTVLPILCIAVAIVAAYATAGLYGIALAAVGMPVSYTHLRSAPTSAAFV